MTRTRIPQLWSLGAVGALAGIAWAAGLRAYMWFISETPHVDWVGTFLGILLPGAVCGALLGIAEARRRAGVVRGLRWFALAPLAFAVGALSMPSQFIQLVTIGQGGGALGVALLAIAGGFALGQQGRPWVRIVVGVLALGLLGGIVGTVYFVGDFPPDSASGAWVAVLVASLLVVLALASSIPFRTARAAESA